MHNFGRGAKWVPGRIIGTVSPRNYDVQVGDTLWKRHGEQLHPRLVPQMQCSKLVHELEVPEPMDISSSVRDDMPITTSPPAVTKETEASKPIPVVNTLVINSEPDVIPKPQSPHSQKILLHQHCYLKKKNRMEIPSQGL